MPVPLPDPLPGAAPCQQHGPRLSQAAAGAAAAPAGRLLPAAGGQRGLPCPGGTSGACRRGRPRPGCWGAGCLCSISGKRSSFGSRNDDTCGSAAVDAKPGLALGCCRGRPARRGGHSPQRHRLSRGGGACSGVTVSLSAGESLGIPREPRGCAGSGCPRSNSAVSRGKGT